MRRLISVTLVLFFLGVSIGLAQQPASQAGKIVSMHKREHPSPMGGSDAPTKPQRMSTMSRSKREEKPTRPFTTSTRPLIPPGTRAKT